MVRSVYRTALVAALLVGTASAATQGPPAYTYSGAAPSGPCVGPRVWLDSTTGTGFYYCNAGTWAAMTTGGGGGSPAGATGNIQYNAGAGFGASSNLTYSAGTLTFGNASGSDAISFTTNGARLRLGTGNDYLTSLAGTGISTPATITAAGFNVGGAGTGATAYGLPTWSALQWNGGGSALYTDGAGTNLTIQASAGTTFPNTLTSNVAGGYDAIKFQQVGARLRFSLGTNNDYFYSDSGNGYRITTPGAIAAGSFVGALTGNASTATALSTTGAAGTFWANNNTWATPPGGGGGAPTTATYWTATTEAGLSAEVNLGALTTGLLKHTVTAGVSAPATAASGTDYGPPTSGNATGLVYSTTGTGAHTTYAGATCTLPNVITALGATGSATCAQPTNVSGSAASATGNAGTATALSTAGAANQFWKNGNVWGQPAFTDLSGSATAAQIPTASTTLGGVKQAAACGAGTHIASIVAGELTCTADSGGSLSAATATVLGGVKGNGTTTACSGTDKMTGWDAAGAMTCGADAGAGGAPNYVEVDVTFAATGDNLVTTVVTGQAWVTATSKITCSPTMLATSTKAEGEEDAVIERLSAAIHTRVAGTGFSLTVMPAEGDASGVYRFHCVGG